MNRPDRTYHLEVAPSEIHGHGLFAAHALTAGCFIGSYGGPEVMEDGEHVLWVEQDGGEWTGYEGRNCLRYLNHSRIPNAQMDGLDCYALRDIAAGEEITIDYGWDDA